MQTGADRQVQTGADGPLSQSNLLTLLVVASGGAGVPGRLMSHVTATSCRKLATPLKLDPAAQLPSPVDRLFRIWYWDRQFLYCNNEFQQDLRQADLPTTSVLTSTQSFWSFLASPCFLASFPFQRHQDLLLHQAPKSSLSLCFSWVTQTHAAAATSYHDPQSTIHTTCKHEMVVACIHIV